MCPGCAGPEQLRSIFWGFEAAKEKVKKEVSGSSFFFGFEEIVRRVSDMRSDGQGKIHGMSRFARNERAHSRFCTVQLHVLTL